MAGISKAEREARARRAARNERRNENRRIRRGNIREFNTAFGKQATKMGYSGQLSERQTARVVREMNKTSSGRRLTAGARVVARGGKASVGTGE